MAKQDKKKDKKKDKKIPFLAQGINSVDWDGINSNQPADAILLFK